MIGKVELSQINQEISAAAEKLEFGHIEVSIKIRDGKLQLLEVSTTRQFKPESQHGG